MPTADLDTLLQQTLEDVRLTRGEKQVLRGVLADLDLDEQKAGVFRHRAFDLARSALQHEDAAKVLDWLEEIVKILHAAPEPAAAGPTAEACFSPGDNCPGRIASLLSDATRKVDICVFTITDDRITSAILAAHKRQVAVRIISDNEKMDDPGSDILRLQGAGIPVRVDRTEFHMHHKFAIFDDAKLLTGSYNWTRGAADYNMENFLVIDHPRLVQRYGSVYEGLWKRLE